MAIYSKCHLYWLYKDFDENVSCAIFIASPDGLDSLNVVFSEAVM